MGQLTAVDPQNSCRFYRVNLFTNAISRFTTISMALICARVNRALIGRLIISYSQNISKYSFS